MLSADTKALDHDALIRAMVGRSLAAIYPVRKPQPGKTVLECQTLSEGKIFQDISFAGPRRGDRRHVRACRQRPHRCCQGAVRREAGDIRHDILIDGKAADIRTPADAVDRGIALVTEDRKRDGLALELTAIDNGGLASMKAVSRSGILDRRRAAQSCRHQAGRSRGPAARPSAEGAAIQRRQSAEDRAGQMAARRKCSSVHIRRADAGCRYCDQGRNLQHHRASSRMQAAPSC